MTSNIPDWLDFLEAQGYVFFLEEQHDMTHEERALQECFNEALLDQYPLMRWAENHQR